MASEAKPETLVNTSILAPEKIITNPSSQDVVDSNRSVSLNGDAGIDEQKLQVAEGTDSALASADVSLNGSDNEAVKGGSDSQGHVRSTSTFKKPNFKAVSVNKTFLAKGAVPVPVQPATTAGIDRQSPAPTTTLRPRLVAKSGSLREAVPPTTSAGGITPASAVWNKNQPPPPPEQKRITDEELKLQYGIHLATRLQSDDPGRQANWADIDDDDDDWAPESIEWTDGTKISLPSAEESSQAFAKPISPAAATELATTETVKPKSPAPTGLSSSLKLGGMSSTTGRGLVLKGASEKPTLVAKPPGPPTPVKSPWASLPPVDKATPISIEIPQSQQPPQPRFVQKDLHGFDAMPPLPAKEIAADDFSRSTWREGSSNTSRELYNSQSGRYEPVHDGRRGSGKADSLGRQPALLQRPSQEQQGPAEPSAAFQTHRASGQDGSFGRRRASSNLSGCSGSFARRLSRGQEMHAQFDIAGDRRASLVAVVDDESPRNFSPSAPHTIQRINRTLSHTIHDSPVLSHSSPTSVHGQAVQSPPQPDMQSDIELQKKIMRESRELARKRRLEQEAKEEAERKERIRLKLEAMGPAPESRKAKKETSKPEATEPIVIQTREESMTAISSPKLLVTDIAGEAKQYGMMKIHDPEPLVAASVTQISEDRSNVNDKRLNGVHPSVVGKDSHTHVNPSWQGSSATPSTWGSATTASAHGQNVWGPPSNDKTLGNGTFNPELSRLPNIHGGSSNPGPIAPPGTNSRANTSYQRGSRESYAQRPAPIGPPMRNVQQGAHGHQEARERSMAAGWTSLPEELARQDAQAHEDQERRDAARRDMQISGQSHNIANTIFKDTWKKVALTEDGSRSDVLEISRVVDVGKGSAQWNSLSHQAELARNERFVPQNDISGPSNDTWKQAHLQDGTPVVASTASPPTRGSRFFPTRDVRLEEYGQSFTRPGSPSPPPPTMAGHPAYDGDISRPHVLLPPPIARVRLPPSHILAPIAPPKPVSFAAAVATPIAVLAPLPPPQKLKSQDLGGRAYNVAPTMVRGSDNWQDRFNSLMGKKSSPPKTHALAVDSSSKNALELPSAYSGATVSLPTVFTLSQSEDESSFTTKPLAEGCFEEQEMGSLPSVKLPTKAPEAAWHLSLSQNKLLPRKFIVSDAMTVEDIKTQAITTLIVRIPGMIKPHTVPFRVERQQSNPRKAGLRGGSTRHAPPHSRGGRHRDLASSHSSPSADSSVATATSFRGRGRATPSANWATRNSSTTSGAINA